MLLTVTTAASSVTTDTVLVGLSHLTIAPRLSAINLVGTIVLPPMTAGGTSRITTLSFTLAVGLSICNMIVLSFLLPV